LRGYTSLYIRLFWDDAVRCHRLCWGRHFCRALLKRHRILRRGCRALFRGYRLFSEDIWLFWEDIWLFISGFFEMVQWCTAEWFQGTTFAGLFWKDTGFFWGGVGLFPDLVFSYDWRFVGSSSFISHVTWLIHIPCDMTHSYPMWHDSFISHVTCMWHDSFISHVTWLIHIPCDMTHSYPMWNHSFISHVTPIITIPCDVTHSQDRCASSRATPPPPPN